MVVKWATHYSSMHRILLVGEGDFSFSLSLANAFGSASNIVATSLDSYDTVVKKYDRAKENLENLRKLGAMILHENDATKMELHPKLMMQKFDRIIFNFPHAGFIGKEDNELVIDHHRQLVNGFLKNASSMLRQCGEVHVSHKIGVPFHMWNLEELASNNSLVLIECVNFDIKDYPGYSNKRGAGPRCNEPFPLGECRTFMFKIGNPRKRKNVTESMTGFEFRALMDNSCYLESFSRSLLPATTIYHQEGIMNTLQWSSGSGIPNAFMNRPRDSAFNARKVFRSNEYVNEEPRNTVIGCSNNQEELRIRNLSRNDWQRYLIRKHGKEKEAK